MGDVAGEEGRGLVMESLVGVLTEEFGLSQGHLEHIE